MRASFLALWFALYQAAFHLISCVFTSPAMKPLIQESIMMYSGVFEEVSDAFEGRAKKMQRTRRNKDLMELVEDFMLNSNE